MWLIKKAFPALRSAAVALEEAQTHTPRVGHTHRVPAPASRGRMLSRRRVRLGPCGRGQGVGFPDILNV